MQLLDENTKQQLLEQYPEKYHELLLKQILVLQDTIEQHIDKYQTNKDFRSAIHLMLSDIIQGKYLGINPLN
jgi:hypothetical protein